MHVVRGGRARLGLTPNGADEIFKEQAAVVYKRCTMGEFLEDLRFIFSGRLESAPGESQLGLEVDPCQIVELLQLNEDSSLEITSPRERHLPRR